MSTERVEISGVQDSARDAKWAEQAPVCWAAWPTQSARGCDGAFLQLPPPTPPDELVKLSLGAQAGSGPSNKPLSSSAAKADLGDSHKDARVSMGHTERFPTK